MNSQNEIIKYFLSFICKYKTEKMEKLPTCY